MTGAAPQAAKAEIPLPGGRKIFLVILASLLLLAQAIPLIQTRWVEDESFAAAEGGNVANHGEWRIREFAPGKLSVFNGRPPLNTLFLAGSFKAFGTNLYAAKLPYLAGGAAGIFLTYLLGCELGGVWLGLAGAFFLAADNYYFLAARSARPEALVAAFTVGAVLLFLYSLRRQSAGLALLAGVVAGMGVQVHPNGLAAATSAGILALMEYRFRIIRRAQPWAFVTGLLGCLMPFVLWAKSDPVRWTEFLRIYREGEGPKLSDIPQLELSRYRDFIGMANTRFGMHIPIPYRLHVVLALLAAFWILYRYQRSLCWKLTALIAPCMLWWAFLRFQTPRYTATASPYFALLLAGAALAIWQRRPAWRRGVVLVSAGFLLVEVASNYALLYTFRKADYVQVSRGLERLIPRDGGVYGALTFWMSLNDHDYFPWNKVPLSYALNHGARYLILNDRVLLHGSGFGKDDWAEVRKTATEFVEAHATLIGHVPNDFYGDLEVYRVNDRRVNDQATSPAPALR